MKTLFIFLLSALTCFSKIYPSTDWIGTNILNLNSGVTTSGIPNLIIGSDATTTYSIISADHTNNGGANLIIRGGDNYYGGSPNSGDSLQIRAGSGAGGTDTAGTLTLGGQTNRDGTFGTTTILGSVVSSNLLQQVTNIVATSGVVTNGAGLNYPAANNHSGTLSGNAGGFNGCYQYLTYPAGNYGNQTMAKYDIINGVELYYPDPDGISQPLLADQSHNLYVPAGLYDGNQSLGNPGAIFSTTGEGGVYWNNNVTASEGVAGSDSATLRIASHDYGDGGYGSVVIGNIDDGGGPGSPNNGLIMNSQAGNTTIAMDADSGYATFGGNVGVGLSNPLYTLDVNGSIGNSYGDTIFQSGTDNFYIKGGSPSLRLKTNGGGGACSLGFYTFGFSWTNAAAQWKFSDRGGYTGQSIFSVCSGGSGSAALRPMVAIGSNGDTGGGKISGSYTSGMAIGESYTSGTFQMPDNGLIVQGSIGVGTTTPGATVDISGTVHSSGNYTNDATIFAGTVTAATAITERAKDVAPHVTTSAATSGTVTASTSYWNETVYLVNFSTIASITIALPSSGTVAGQIYRIHTKSSVTTLSVTGGSFLDTAVVTLTAGQTIAYQATTTTGTYIRIQ